MKMPPAVGHAKRPAQPFGTHGADVQDLGLGDAIHDVGHQHLLGSGNELLATG